MSRREGRDNRGGCQVAQAVVGTAPADDNHRSIAGPSEGITEADHDPDSGRYRHHIPGVRSTADVGESRDSGTTGATIMERLRKKSETRVQELVSTF